MVGTKILCTGSYFYNLYFLYRLEATKSAILPELVELTNDEESYVRIAGLETVVSILTLVDEGELETEIAYNFKAQVNFYNFTVFLITNLFAFL